MTPKTTAIEFLKLAGSGQVREAYAKHIAPDFIHHNLYFKGDRESLLKAMEEAHLSHPNKSIDVKFAYQDGDRVILHSLVIKETMEIAVVHIFRFSGNKIVELWDVGMQIPADSPNQNGAF
jgi:predicted SnoaL-like aldol condensation-catalyzing enzyme